MGGQALHCPIVTPTSPPTGTLAPGAPAGAPAGASATLNERDARRVLLLRACEASPDAARALWTPEDRLWASRAATESAGTAGKPARWLAERARHAMQRLRPRQPSLDALLRGRLWRWSWLLWAGLVSAAFGLLTDGLASGQSISLLAPPWLGVLVWNGLVYLVLLWAALRGPSTGASHGASAPAAATSPRGLVRRLLAWWMARPVKSAGSQVAVAFAAEWARIGGPLHGARAAALLHLGAAWFAGGLVAGLYLRGLVFDFRAGWQSTFLDAEAVHRVLAIVLAPASAVTGIAVPDLAGIAALQVTAQTPATASAAPWIHLMAATLALFVIAPRLLLALAAALRSGWRARHLTLPLDEPYFQHLLLQGRRGPAVVQVLPHGAALTPQATLGLQAWLRAGLGEDLKMSVAPTVAYGHEDDALPAPDPATTLRVLLFDLASTPEPEAQGRLVQRLRAERLPLLVLTDESAAARRWAGLPERLAGRRTAWLHWAGEQGLPALSVVLEAPDHAGAAAALQQALSSAR